ncbi:hypothetical protein BC567DRAFT_46437 [Phyllosticta citribraziliensis]
MSFTYHPNQPSWSSTKPASRGPAISSLLRGQQQQTPLGRAKLSLFAHAFVFCQPASHMKAAGNSRARFVSLPLYYASLSLQRYTSAVFYVSGGRTRLMLLVGFVFVCTHPRRGRWSGRKEGKEGGRSVVGISGCMWRLHSDGEQGFGGCVPLRL